MPNIEVVGLHYYPIKSCGGIEAESVAFSELGIEHDREWMLIGAKGQLLSQRTHPELALVKTALTDESLVITAPALGEIAIPLEHNTDQEIVSVTLWKKPGTGTNEGSKPNEYFSTYLGKDARLIRVQRPRVIKAECRIEGASTQTGFADGFPILLTSVESLRELNAHIEHPVTMDRFRPNIIVEGAYAYDEDYWREIQMGALRGFVVRACARCPVPNVDQQTGKLAKERPVTEALEATRKGIDDIDDAKGRFFGQNVAHVFEPGSTLQVGAKVSVLNRASERNFQLV